MNSPETVLAPVYPSISFEELGRLLRKNGYEIEPIAGAVKPSYRTLTEPRFTIELTTPLDLRPGEFALIHLWTRLQLAPQMLESVQRYVRLRALSAQLLTNSRGTLVVVQQIIVGGGITAYYLRDQFWHWCQTLKDVRDAVRSNLARLQGKTLH